MHILITGGTGYLGSKLVERWSKNNYKITILTRNVLLHEIRNTPSNITHVDTLPDVHESKFDAVVNLAGAPILGRRWTAKQKAKLINSRVNTTKMVVDWMAESSTPPKTFISASAIGYYGTQPNGSKIPLCERADPTEEFMSEICQRWEAASKRLCELHIRRVIFRIGVVLGASGGALVQMKRPFHFFLGGKIGSGKQITSWVHIDDLVGAFDRALHDDAFDGAYNLTAPHPVSNEVLMKNIGSAMNRPAFTTMPTFALNMLMGEQSQLLTKGQFVIPKALQDQGFRFRYPTIDKALKHIFK